MVFIQAAVTAACSRPRSWQVAQDEPRVRSMQNAASETRRQKK